MKIDLSKAEGNAFQLIGLAMDLGKKSGMSDNERFTMREEMCSGDYQNLLNVFKKNFPFVKWVNKPIDK